MLSSLSFPRKMVSFSVLFLLVLGKDIGSNDNTVPLIVCNDSFEFLFYTSCYNFSPYCLIACVVTFVCRQLFELSICRDVSA